MKQIKIKVKGEKKLILNKNNYNLWYKSLTE